jgi:hypothetical protein
MPTSRPERARLRALYRDLAAVRALASELAHIEYENPHDGKTIVLRVTDATYEQMLQDAYDDWNCLHAQLQIRSQRGLPERKGSLRFA